MWCTSLSLSWIFSYFFFSFIYFAIHPLSLVYGVAASYHATGCWFKCISDWFEMQRGKKEGMAWHGTARHAIDPCTASSSSLIIHNYFVVVAVGSSSFFMNEPCAQALIDKKQEPSGRALRLCVGTTLRAQESMCIDYNLLPKKKVKVFVGNEVFSNTNYTNLNAKE